MAERVIGGSGTPEDGGQASTSVEPGAPQARAAGPMPVDGSSPTANQSPAEPSVEVAQAGAGGPPRIGEIRELTAP
ncbi:MAG: hypothetical protein ACREGL_11625, partial [Alphaproteobacteria bacterium]